MERIANVGVACHVYGVPVVVKLEPTKVDWRLAEDKPRV